MVGKQEKFMLRSDDTFSTAEVVCRQSKITYHRKLLLENYSYYIINIIIV